MLEYENSEESALRFSTTPSAPLVPFLPFLAVAVAFPESFTGGACKLAQRRPVEEVGRSR